MKNLFLIAVLCVSVSIASFAQTVKTEKFDVAGNCGMCKSRIEKAIKAVDGVSAAAWDNDAKVAEVTFDAAKTDLDKIQLAVATVGHDTKMHKAADDVYSNLPGCCKYDRVKAVGTNGNTPDSGKDGGCKSSCCKKK